MAKPSGQVVKGIGHGTIEITEGIVTINKGSKGQNYDNFEGQIDNDGHVVANFHFNPCNHCGMEDKSVVFEGNINKLKLNGYYNDINVNFYLTKK